MSAKRINSSNESILLLGQVGGLQDISEPFYWIEPLEYGESEQFLNGSEPVNSQFFVPGNGSQ
ncbi:hypothetical protein RCH14_001713 [Massilia sp. MP_M2]|uniref:hypothetical protein n=1 Tax=Massilia sp. MP_M2 TaxID=3071713 RepID=UPI00319EB5B4